MSRQLLEHPDHRKTHRAVQQAVSEVQHAIRPCRDGMLSWLLALSAGAVVAWRGFQAAVQDRPIRSANVPAELLQPSEHEPRYSDTNSARLRGGVPALPQPYEPYDAKTPENSAAGTTTANPSAMPANPAAIPARDGVSLAKEFIARYNAGDCPARAAALSFFGILTLVPLLLFAVAALGFFIRDPNQARQYVEHVIANLLPGQQATQAANQVIQQTNLVDSARSLMAGKWWTIVFGFLALIYSVLGLFVSATDPMNVTWEVKETRSFLKLRMVCLSVFAGAGIFFLLSLIISSGLWHPADAGWLVNALLVVCYEALAIGLNALMFTLIYRFLPNAPVTWRAAAFGGLVTGVLYEIFKKGFEFYLSTFGNLDNKMYGALGGIVLLVTWIYYGSMLLLAGAIVAKMYHEHREEGGIQKRVGAGR